LPSVLQQWVDHEARQAGLLTALAGSSQRMMQGLVLDGSAPLFGRAHEMMELKPIALGYLGEGSGICNPVELVKHYAVWGGIPRYWEIAEPFGERLDAAVDRCVLAPLSPLHREPDRLLLDEIPPALALRPILDAIGLGAHRLTEISARIGQPATSLGRPLLRLMGMGLVRRDTPFGEPEKSAKRALYRIADPFMRLWFRIVAPHRALLAEAPAAVRMGMWNAARTDLYAAAWEEVCRMAIAGLAQVKPQLRRYGAWMPGGRFWCGNGPEWDVVSRTVDGKALLLGEVKWSERPFPPADLKRLATALVAKGVPPVATAHPQRILHALFVPRAQATPELLGAVQVIQAEDVLPCLR
jgi:AAA+ ATPase superfamily predicted ATPase